MSKTVNVTNQELCNYHKQLQTVKGTIWEHYYLNFINDFYKANGIRLETINERVNKLRLEHFECEQEKREGNHLILPKYEDGPVEVEGQQPKKIAICLEGKTQEMYQEAYKALMAETAVLVI